MPERTLEERVSLIEQQFDGKTLEEHFRGQAELLDQRFAAVDSRFAQVDRRLDAITRQLAAVRQGVEILLRRLI